MIFKRTWKKYKGMHTYCYTGWFLFGFIPIYIRRKQITFMMTVNGRTYRCNDIETAADIIFGEIRDEQDYERM